MAPFVRLCLLVIHVAALSTVGAQNCDYSGVANPLYLLEGSLAGTVILNVSSDTILHTDLSPLPPPYLEVENGTLRFKNTLDLDNNPDWCNSVFQLKIYLSCGGLVYTINLRVNFTDDLAPEFTVQSYKATVNELTSVGEVVHRISTADIEDKDCQSNLQNPVYAIEDGNTGGAFSIVQHTGETRVNRTLDYENGDTRFLLNISISERAYPDRKSFTTLNVTVVDLDDNDPVFDNSAYTLHVPENAPPSGLWTQTVPHISVHDPDLGVVPADPLLIALYDTSAAGILEVNGTTGDVRLLKAFDREYQESVPIVLKVQQTINSWRSSTVTLTVLIDDVNDNRPAFSPHHYDVTVSEHAAAGTTVVLVSASDKDTGDNALFNFTLLQGGEGFSLTTQLGQHGLLSVIDPSLLDRETTPQINITIGAQERTPADGGNCSLIQCQATVTVTLSDINDNSPVFDNDTYVAHVSNDNVSNRDVIATVSASDKDEGENAVVTYRLQSLSFGACADVIVVMDPGSGDVRLNNTVAQSEDCSVLITACDSPTEVTQQRCTSVPMQIIFHISNYTVMLRTSVSPDVLTPEKAVIGRELSAILGVTVTVDHTYPDTGSSGSRVFISAKNTSTAELLPREQLQPLVDEKMTEITQFFERYLQTEEPGDDDDNNNNNAGLSLIAIAFIAVSAVFLLAFIVAVIFVSRGREKTRRQERLIQRLSASNDLYDNTADGHKAENGTASLVDHIAVADDSRTEGLGVTNPVYVEENDDSPADSPRSDVTSDSGPDGSAWETTTRERSGGKEEGEEEESFRERTQDADSGVPSDRENGPGDSGSEASKEATPLMPRSEREGGGGGDTTSSPSSPSSSYLDAVLNDKLLQVAHYDDVGDDASDMVDVTAVPSLPATTTTTTASADVQAQVVAADAAAHPYQNVSGDVSANTVADDPHVYVNATEDRDCPPTADVGEQEGTLVVPAYQNVNLHPAHNAIIPSNDTGRDVSGEPSTTNEENNNKDDEDDDDDDDDVGSRSKLAQMVRPCTPPMHHKQNAEDEEWEGEGANLPDEPEPDYAKKVRFVVPTVVEAPSAAADNQGGVGADDNGGGDATTENGGEQEGGSGGGEKESPAGSSPAGEPDAVGSATGSDDRNVSQTTKSQEGPAGVERAVSVVEEEMTAF